MGIVEHFVVTSASNTRQVKTIVDEVEKQMRERADAKPRAVEGLTDASWVLVDYGDIVVHVFLTEHARVLRPRTAVGRRAARRVGRRRRGLSRRRVTSRTRGGRVIVHSGGQPRTSSSCTSSNPNVR